jgi:hypothetical protein
MANVDVHAPAPAGVEEQRKREVMKKKVPIVGGVATEAIAAVGAAIVAIIGLTGLFASDLAAIAAIALGVALVFQGLAVGAQLSRGTNVLPRVEPEAAEIGVEAIAGLAGVTLGILALAGVAPHTLLSVAAIVLGAGEMFAVHPLSEAIETGSEAVRRVSASASGAHAFAGVSAVVLGITALAMPDVVQLPLVAFLVMSGTLLLAGAAIGGRLLGYLRR